MHIPVLKIVVHKAKNEDTVFVFTSIKFPDGLGYLQFQVVCPVNEGERWVQMELGTANYEVVPEGFEVIAPR